MKKHKYGAIKTKFQGIVFDSKTECQYYKFLLKKQAAGLIKNIELQPSFILMPAFKVDDITIRGIMYIADFRILDKDGHETIIDVKGKATKEALIKRKLFLYKFSDKNLLWVKKARSGWIDYFKKKGEK